MNKADLLSLVRKFSLSSREPSFLPLRLLLALLLGIAAKAKEVFRCSAIRSATQGGSGGILRTTQSSSVLNKEVRTQVHAAPDRQTETENEVKSLCPAVTVYRKHEKARESALPPPELRLVGPGGRGDATVVAAGDNSETAYLLSTA